MIDVCYRSEDMTLQKEKITINITTKKVRTFASYLLLFLVAGILVQLISKR